MTKSVLFSQNKLAARKSALTFFFPHSCNKLFTRSSIQLIRPYLLGPLWSKNILLKVNVLRQIPPTEQKAALSVHLLGFFIKEAIIKFAQIIYQPATILIKVEGSSEIRLFFQRYSLVNKDFGSTVLLTFKGN